MSTGKFLVLENRLDARHAGRLLGSIVSDPHFPLSSIVTESPSWLTADEPAKSKDYVRAVEWEENTRSSVFSVLGFKLEKTTKRRLRIQSEMVNTWGIVNSDSDIFSKLLKDEETALKVKKKMAIEGKLYLITGLRTCVDGVFDGIGSKTTTGTVMQEDLKADRPAAEGTVSYQRSNTVTTDWHEKGVGEEIFAIRYSLIRLKAFALQREVLLKPDPRFKGHATLQAPNPKGTSIVVDLEKEQFEVHGFEVEDMEEWEAKLPVEFEDFVAYGNTETEDGRGINERLSTLAGLFGGAFGFIKLNSRV